MENYFIAFICYIVYHMNMLYFCLLFWLLCICSTYLSNDRYLDHFLFPTTVVIDHLSVYSNIYILLALFLWRTLTNPVHSTMYEQATGTTAPHKRTPALLFICIVAPTCKLPKGKQTLNHLSYFTYFHRSYLCSQSATKASALFFLLNLGERYVNIFYSTTQKKKD